MKCKSCKHFRECLNEALGLGQLFDPEYDGEHGCSDDMFEPITNADRIRAMSDEELADLFRMFCRDIYDCSDCPLYRGGCPGSNEFYAWYSWLQQPAGGE